MNGALANLVADGNSGNDRVAVLLAQFVTFDIVLMITGVHRLRSRLQHKELSGASVLGPLDIHGRRSAGKLRVVVFDPTGPARQFQHFVIAKTETLPLGLDDFAESYAPLVQPIDHL